MTRFRPTILGLMGLVLVVALGLSALARPCRLGAALLSDSLLAALVVALIGCAVGRGTRRHMWIGFAIAGWSLLGLGYVDRSNDGANIPKVIEEMLAVAFKTRDLPPAVVTLPILPTKVVLTQPGFTTTTTTAPTPANGPGLMNNCSPAPAVPSMASFTLGSVTTTRNYGWLDLNPSSFGRVVSPFLAWIVALAGGFLAPRMAGKLTDPGQAQGDAG